MCAELYSCSQSYPVIPFQRAEELTNRDTRTEEIAMLGHCQCQRMAFVTVPVSSVCQNKDVLTNEASMNQPMIIRLVYTSCAFLLMLCASAEIEQDVPMRPFWSWTIKLKTLQDLPRSSRGAYIWGAGFSILFRKLALASLNSEFLRTSAVSLKASLKTLSCNGLVLEINRLGRNILE